MCANAQRDVALPNIDGAAKFGGRPLLQCPAVDAKPSAPNSRTNLSRYGPKFTVL